KCRGQARAPATNAMEETMSDDKQVPGTTANAARITRRSTLKGLAAAAGVGAATHLAPGSMRYVQAQTSEPIRIGFQVHRTGIGATYGRWYDRTTMAAVKLINDNGGIAGRPVEIIAEDDGTDPRRGAEVVEKFAT